MPRLGPTVWVVRHAPRFSIIEAGAARHLVPPIPQYRAVRIARRIAEANQSMLIVQGRHGRIRFCLRAHVRRARPTRIHA